MPMSLKQQAFLLPSSDPATTHNQRGRWAEAIVAHHLEAQGAQLIDQNVHTRRGEIDLVMKRGHNLLFVEVRSLTNTSPRRALASINKRKQAALQHAAMGFLSRYQQQPGNEHINWGVEFLCVGLSFQRDGSLHLTSAPLYLW